MIGCPEEVAFKKGWIDDELLNKIIQKNQNMYSEYLMKIINNK